MKIKDFEYNLIDQIYEFDGLWGVKSKCGLKIIENKGTTIIILTELYDINTGNSVTECCSILANKLCSENNLDPEKITFIQHSPEINSKLDFYEETFELISFQGEGAKFTEPDWKSMSRKEVEEMIQ